MSYLFSSPVADGCVDKKAVLLLAYCACLVLDVFFNLLLNLLSGHSLIFPEKMNGSVDYCETATASGYSIF